MKTRIVLVVLAVAFLLAALSMAIRPVYGAEGVIDQPNPLYLSEVQVDVYRRPPFSVAPLRVGSGYTVTLTHKPTGTISHQEPTELGTVVFENVYRAEYGITMEYEPSYANPYRRWRWVCALDVTVDDPYEFFTLLCVPKWDLWLPWGKN